MGRVVLVVVGDEYTRFDKLVLKLVQGLGQKAVSVTLTSGVSFRARDGLGFS